MTIAVTDTKGTKTNARPKRTAAVFEPVRVRLTLEGLTPLMQHSTRHYETKKPKDALAWEREHYLEYLHETESGQVKILQEAIKRTLMEGCKFYPDKPKGMSAKTFAPLIQAALIVEDDALVFRGRSPVTRADAIADERTVVQNRTRIMRVRPVIPLPWSASTTLVVADPQIAGETLEAIADRAFRWVGLHEGRTIGFGRAIPTLEVVQ